MMSRFGKDLKVYDKIKVWWSIWLPNQDVIIELKPYKGPLEYLFPQGAQIAKFISGIRMTIDNSDLYVVMDS